MDFERSVTEELIQWKGKAKKPYLLMNLPYFLATEIDVYIAYFVETYRLGEG